MRRTSAASSAVSRRSCILLAVPEERDRLHEEFRSKLAARAFITKSDPEYLEIMAPGVDKGAALEEISRFYGIDASEVMAVGDADNDLGMLGDGRLGRGGRERRASRQGRGEGRHGAYERRGGGRRGGAALGPRRDPLIASPGLRARHEIPSTFGRLHGRDAALLGLVVFSAYVFVLAPCLTSVRSASV